MYQERLREVNTLANIQLQKEDKKVLRFFYLLRDDIFVSKVGDADEKEAAE